MECPNCQPLKEQLAEAQSDASCAKFDMETYKTRAVNAEHLLSTQTEALKALRDASAKEQRVANNLALAYTSGWYSCPDVPPHEHRDICGKCLECLTSDVPALATPEPAKCELCGPDKDGAHPGDCPNFPTKSFQRSIGAVPTICGECRGECRGHQAPAKSAEPCAHPVTELSSDGKYERCAYGCHLEWLRECAPPTPPEKEPCCIKLNGKFMGKNKMIHRPNCPDGAERFRPTPPEKKEKP